MPCCGYGSWGPSRRPVEQLHGQRGSWTAFGVPVVALHFSMAGELPSPHDYLVSRRTFLDEEAHVDERVDSEEPSTISTQVEDEIPRTPAAQANLRTFLDEEAHVDERVDSEEPSSISTQVEDEIPRTPAAQANEPNIATWLSIQGQTPFEHRLDYEACFRTAFEILTNQPWRIEFSRDYTPTVRGAPAEWEWHVRSTCLFNDINHIVFVPASATSTRVSSWNSEERESLDRWLNESVTELPCEPDFAGDTSLLNDLTKETTETEQERIEEAHSRFKFCEFETLSDGSDAWSDFQYVGPQQEAAEDDERAAMMGRSPNSEGYEDRFERAAEVTVQEENVMVEHLAALRRSEPLSDDDISGHAGAAEPNVFLHNATSSANHAVQGALGKGKRQSKKRKSLAKEDIAAMRTHQREDAIRRSRAWAPRGAHAFPSTAASSSERG
jgi:hypothetical protein